jgi:hypothetical protein
MVGLGEASMAWRLWLLRDFIAAYDATETSVDDGLF